MPTNSVRAAERSRDDRADLERAEPEANEVAREENAHDTISEAAKGPSEENAPRVGQARRPRHLIGTTLGGT
jgi:hypothetical protein